MIPVKNIIEVAHRLKRHVRETPLQYSETLSAVYDADIYLKREDLQLGRSYKIRGGFNKMSSLTEGERSKGVVCASAGNHAQAVAISCARLEIHGTIFMPKTTPGQKIKKVKAFGKEFVKVKLFGDTFDDAYGQAKAYRDEHDVTFIHPFDDERVIEGQGTVGKEIYEQFEGEPDYIFGPIGGGGLLSGVGSYFSQVSPDTKIIGAEPAGAASMKLAFEHNEIQTFPDMDRFVDGAAVARVGKLNFAICKQVLQDILVVPEGRVCTAILDMYNEDAIVVEPSGALSIAALDQYRDEIKGKQVVCIVSGGNNDITRMEEIKERSLLFEGLKQYFIINFPRRVGSFKHFVTEVLGPKDSITLMQYDSQKSSGESCPALIGIVVKEADAQREFLERLEETGWTYESVNDSPLLYNYLAK